jgi:hypothetical protein
VPRTAAAASAALLLLLPFPLVATAGDTGPSFPAPFPAATFVPAPAPLPLLASSCLRNADTCPIRKGLCRQYTVPPLWWRGCSEFLHLRWGL